jgi:hypothetical protein
MQRNGPTVQGLSSLQALSSSRLLWLTYLTVKWGHKASILHCAVNTLRKLTTAVDSAAEQQAKLNSEINRLASFNQQILDELNVYRVEKGLPPVQNLPSRDPVSTPTTVIMSPKSEPDSDDTTSMMTSNALDELLSFESGDSVIEDLCSPTKAVTPQPEQSDHDYIEPAAYLSSDYGMGTIVVLHWIVNTTTKMMTPVRHSVQIGLKTATYEAYDPLVIPTQYTSFETNQQFVIQQHHLAAPQSNHLYNFGLFAILFFMLPYALGVGESAGEITTLASRSLLSISTSYMYALVVIIATRPFFSDIKTKPRHLHFSATPWIGLVVLVALLIAIWAAAGLAWAFAPKQVAIVPSPATIKQNTLMNKVFGLSMSIHEPSGLTTKLLSK